MVTFRDPEHSALLCVSTGSAEGCHLQAALCQMAMQF